MDENTTPEGLEQPDLWLVDRLVDAAGADDAAGTDGADGADTPVTHSVDSEGVRMARIVDALRQPATGAELSAEQSYLRAFDEVLSPESKPVRAIVIGTRAAIVAGIAVLAAATGAAAYTGSLPGPLQRAAHSVVGAPAEDQGSDEATDDPSDEPTGTPTQSPSQTPTETPIGSPTSARGVGPDATGPAAFGLCNAWSHGGLSTTSVAYRNLATAAGGPDGIAAYCATIVKPGNGSTHGTGSPTAHPHGSPTAHPHGSPRSHPGKASHPTGSPTTHPGGH